MHRKRNAQKYVAGNRHTDTHTDANLRSHAGSYEPGSDNEHLDFMELNLSWIQLCEGFSLVMKPAIIKSNPK